MAHSGALPDIRLKSLGTAEKESIIKDAKANDKSKDTKSCCGVSVFVKSTFYLMNFNPDY